MAGKWKRIVDIATAEGLRGGRQVLQGRKGKWVVECSTAQFPNSIFERKPLCVFSLLLHFYLRLFILLSSPTVSFSYLFRFRIRKDSANLVFCFSSLRFAFPSALYFCFLFLCYYIKADEERTFTFEFFHFSRHYRLKMLCRCPSSF